MVFGHKASGILDKGIPTDLTTKRIPRPAPGGMRRYLVAVQQQTADRVGFAVGAFPATAAHLHETDRIRKTLEPSWRQRNVVGVSQTSDYVTQIFGNQELPCGPSRGDTRSQVDG